MDNFVSNKLKSLGKDYFLTEFNAVNTTSQPITFDLFNSNTIVDIPTSPAPVLPPSVTSNLYSFSGIPYGLAINTTNNNLYLVNGTNNVFVFDLFTGTLLNTLVGNVGSIYNTITYDSANNNMLLTNQAVSPFQVVVLSCSSNSFSNYSAPSGTNIPDLILTQPVYYNTLLNPSNQNLYIPTQSTTAPTRSLTKYNTQNNTFIGNVNLGNTPYPSVVPNYIPSTQSLGSVLGTFNNLLYVALASNQLGIINIIDNTLINTIPLPPTYFFQSVTGSYNCVSYSPFNNTLYVGVVVPITTPYQINSNQILSFDCNTNTFIGLISSTSDLLPISRTNTSSDILLGTGTIGSIVFDYQNNNIWVSRLSVIQIIDVNTNTIIAVTSTVPANNVTSMAYNPLTNRIYATVGGNIAVFDANTYTQIGALFGGFPTNLGAIQFRIVNNSMYVTDSSIDLIRVFDCNTNTFTGTLTPSTGAVITNLKYNPNNDKLYGTCGTNIIISYDFNTTSFSNITVPSLGFNTQIEVDTTNNQIYVGGLYNSLILINANTDTYVSTIPHSIIGQSGFVYGMSYDNVHDVLYYSNATGVMVLNCAQNIPFFNIVPQTLISSTGKLVYTSGFGYGGNPNLLYYLDGDALNGQVIHIAAPENRFATPIYNSIKDSIYYVYNDPYAFPQYNGCYILELDCASGIVSENWLGIPYQNYRPSQMAINILINSGTLYIPTSINNGNIFIYNCILNTVISTIINPSYSSGVTQSICVSSGNIYFINQNSLIELDFNTNIFSSPITINFMGQIGYNYLDNLLYISTYNPDVVVFDVSTNSILQTIPLPDDVYRINYSYTNNTIYLQCLSFIQPVIPPALGQFSTYCPTNNCIYLGSNGNLGEVSVYNCSNDLLVATITVNPNSIQCAFNSQSNQMYVTCSSGFVDVIDCVSNTVVTSINIPTSSPYNIAYNSSLNLMYVTDIANNQIININCNNNTVSSSYSISPNTIPNGLIYNPISNSNLLFSSDGINAVVQNLAPAQVTTTYIGGSPTYNYNTFIQDKASNPFLVNSVMLYSDNPSNLNQVFFATVKDATGEITYDPKLPALDISPNQFQASVTYVDFGKKGFVFNEQSSFSDFTVQPFSSVRIVLIQKQFNSNSEFTNPKSNMDAIMNDIGLYPIPNPDKTKIVRDSVRAVPLNTPTPAPKPIKKKKPLKPNKCAELWKDNYGIDGSEEINLQNQKSEILGLPTKFVVGLGVGLLAVVGGIIIYKTK